MTTVRALMAEHGICERTAYRWLKSGRRRKRKVPEDVVARMRDMVASGMTYRAVGAALGVDYTTVWHKARLSSRHWKTRAPLADVPRLEPGEVVLSEYARKHGLLVHTLSQAVRRGAFDARLVVHNGKRCYAAELLELLAWLAIARLPRTVRTPQRKPRVKLAPSLIAAIRERVVLGWTYRRVSAALRVDICTVSKYAHDVCRRDRNKARA